MAATNDKTSSVFVTKEKFEVAAKDVGLSAEVANALWSKLGESSSQRIIAGATAPRQDAANVNNWHWSEIDMLPWAKKRLEQVCLGVEGKGVPDKGWCKVTKMEKCEGEASVPQACRAWPRPCVGGWASQPRAASTAATAPQSRLSVPPRRCRRPVALPVLDRQRVSYVQVSNRKGKRIVAFELSVKCKWEGQVGAALRGALCDAPCDAPCDVPCAALCDAPCDLPICCTM